MGFASGGLSAAQMLAALSDDGNKLEQPISMLDFWSIPTLGAAPIALNTTPGDKTLPNVTLPNISGLSIEVAYAMLFVGRVTCAGTNHLDSESYIQLDKAAAGYIDGILMSADSIGTEGMAAPNLVYYKIVGHIDISSRVAFNATTNFKWLAASVNASSLSLYGVCTGVRVIVS